jgi:DNA polymerase-3 subunit epsilon
MGSMPMDQSLFGDDEHVPPEPEPAAATIRDWQIDLIRKALDARGLVSMDARQALVENLAGRPVESLRAMTHDEAMVAISSLGASAPRPHELRRCGTAVTRTHGSTDCDWPWLRKLTHSVGPVWEHEARPLHLGAGPSTIEVLER